MEARAAASTPIAPDQRHARPRPAARLSCDRKYCGEIDDVRWARVRVVWVH